MPEDCGGCAGLGSHRRWCPVVVGRNASYIGRLAEQAGALGDSIGPNECGAANHAWAASALLRAKAQELAAEFQAATVSSPTDVEEAT